MNDANHLHPKTYPLIIILIGTSILAVPAAVGTYALVADSSFGTPKDAFGSWLFWISVMGFLLFAGYILTAVFKKHTALLWLPSLLYNFALSCAYVYMFLQGFGGMPLYALFYSALTSGAVLLPLWTIYVTGASFYYLRHSFGNGTKILP